MKTIRVYMLNGHHAKDVQMSMEGFVGLLRDAESRPSGIVHFSDGAGFRWAVRPSAVSHVVEDKI